MNYRREAGIELHGMLKRFMLLSGLLLLNYLPALAGEPVQPKGNVPLGSPDFYPSPENPVGWRGDGTGRYPGATPPVHWGRICKQTAALKCAAAVPKDGSTANADSAGLGFFTEWLVAGPIPCADAAGAIKDELTPGEAALAPQAGDKLGGAAWRETKTEDSFLDLWALFGGMTKEQASYAQTCLYSAQPCKMWFHFKYLRGLALWLNGTVKHSRCPNEAGGEGPVIELDLQSGWNRFLFKIVPWCVGAAVSDCPSACFIRCRFWPMEEPRDYEEKNIAWLSVMPGLSQAMPVIAGERLFTMAYPYNLVCVEKKSGKILWIRSNSPYDAATAEERKAHSDLFAKMDGLALKRDAYYRDFAAGKLPSAQAVRDETDVEDELDKTMLQVDDKYKRPKEQGEPDWWTIPTPVTDGRCVCVWVARGVSASYDLDGKRRWISYTRPKGQHHGYFSSPAIMAGKFVYYDGRINALDLGDGSVKWSVDDPKKPDWQTQLWFAALNRVVVSGEEYVLCPEGMVMIRARDGRFCGKFGGANVYSTPVLSENRIFQAEETFVARREVTTAADGVAIKDLKNAYWPWQKLLGSPYFYQGHWLDASPLIHEGLGYVVSGSGVLAVFDAATAEPVYEKSLPLDLFRADAGGRRDYCGASLALAGSYIYILGSTGVTIVIKPGRKFEEVARNRIHCLAQANFYPERERKPYKGHTLGNYCYFPWNPQYCPEYQDCTMTSTPVFDGNRMYFRGEENLYCIEEKKP